MISTARPSALWLLILIAPLVGIATVWFGNPALPLALLVLPLILYAGLRAEVGTVAAVLFLVALLVDNPGESPGMGLYQGPLYRPGELVYQAIGYQIGIPQLKLFGLELLLGLVLVLIVLAELPRWLNERGERRRVNPLLRACLVAGLTLLGLFVYGVIVRGGDGRFSMLQLRPLLFALISPLVLGYAWRRPGAVPRMLIGMVVVIFVRTLIGLYYWWTLMRHNVYGGSEGGSGTFVTTHSDSMLVAVALIILAVWLVSSPSGARLVVTLTATPIFLGFLVVNNRRIAFVGIALGLFFIYLGARGPMRDRLNRLAMLAAPFALAYLIAGWGASGSWAAPVQKLKSVVQQKDVSSRTRDIENYNLVATLRPHRMFGTGLGHEYVEEVRAFSLGNFTIYRFIPHNSVLWLWSAGGLIGFTLIWSALGVAVFFAFRLAWFARRESDRILGYITVGAIICFGVMAYADVGLFNFHNGMTFLLPVSLVAGAMSRVDLWSRRRREVP